MQTAFNRHTLSLGLAIFSMFFGAGNVIFPLALGCDTGDKTPFALLGLLLTAALMPVAGVIAMVLFEGNYRSFFGRMGSRPGFVLALLVISLLGPLGSTPRCIALAYTTLKTALPQLSFIWFCLGACALLFLFTVRKRHILTLLGTYLTPLLLLTLGIIIVKGLLSPHLLQQTTLSAPRAFLHGLQEGYNTMDLLAAFFFSSTILQILKHRISRPAPAQLLKEMTLASLLGATLLALVYIGFSYLAAFHGQALASVPKEQLLSVLMLHLAGPWGGLIVCLTVALACLTTAIALITAFTEFLRTEVCKNKIRYEYLLAGALGVTLFMATFRFHGINAFLGPFLHICYPALIVLTLLNMAYRLHHFQPVRVPVYTILIFSALTYMLH